MLWQALGAFVAAFLVSSIFTWQKQHTHAHDALQVQGIPLLGSTLAFARHGVDCLSWASAQAAHAFHISLLSRKYTFLTSPEAVSAFLKAHTEVLQLQPAVEQFTGRCFGLSRNIWHNGEVVLVHALREILSPARVAQLERPMAATLVQLAPAYFDQAQLDLARRLPRWVMHATVHTLFGSRFLDLVPAQDLLDNFVTFDEYFEVRLPSISFSVEQHCLQCGPALSTCARCAHFHTNFLHGTLCPVLSVLSRLELAQSQESSFRHISAAEHGCLRVSVMGLLRIALKAPSLGRCCRPATCVPSLHAVV